MRVNMCCMMHWCTQRVMLLLWELPWIKGIWEKSKSNSANALSQRQERCVIWGWGIGKRRAPRRSLSGEITERKIDTTDLTHSWSQALYKVMPLFKRHGQDVWDGPVYFLKLPVKLKMLGNMRGLASDWPFFFFSIEENSISAICCHWICLVCIMCSVN